MVRRNAVISRMLLAYCCVRIAEWALWSGLLVYTYDAHGKTITGLVTLALLLPGILFAPLIGAVLDGRRPNRVLPLACGVVAMSAVLATLAIGVGAPLLAIVVPSSTALMAVTALGPSLAVLVPDHARSPTELVAGNVMIGRGDSFGALSGPLLASALLGLSGSVLLFTACSLIAISAFVLTVPLLALDPRNRPVSEAAALAMVSVRSRPSSLRTGLRALMTRPGAIPLLAIVCGGHLLLGTLDLTLVVLAREAFAMDSSGPGLLAAAFGFGGLSATFGATLLVARKRLAPVALATLGVVAVVLFVLGSSPRLNVALAVLPIAGLSVALTEISGRMLLQRVAPQNALASIFATVESLRLLACLLGSVIAQVVIALAGVRACLFATAAIFATMLVLTTTGLLTVDADGDAPVVTMRLLRRIDMFALLPGPALEGVARACQPRRVAAGVPVVREGDRADSYFAIAAGDVDVSIAGRHVRTMGRGEGFGEIALLRDVPRTATVTARTPLDVLELDRAAFLEILNEYPASQHVAVAVAQTWLEADNADDVPV